LLSLIVLCLKVSRSSLKRVATLTLLVLAILYLAGVNDLVRIGLILTWVFLDVPLQLKIKEKQQGWQHFLLAVSNRGPRVSTYLQFYTLGLAHLLIITAVASHAVLATLGTVSGDTPAAAATIFKIVHVIVFYDMLLLFVADFVPLERLFLVQKLGFVVFVLLVRFAVQLYLDSSVYKGGEAAADKSKGEPQSQAKGLP